MYHKIENTVRKAPYTVGYRIYWVKNLIIYIYLLII